MNLEEFVNTLTLSTFDNLRVAVIKRHQSNVEKIAEALQYMTKQEALCLAAIKNRPACEKVLAEKTNIEKELAAKVVSRYLELKNHFDGDK